MISTYSIPIKESRLLAIIHRCLTDVLIKATTPFREVKYFHPERRTMPNGVHIQRGGFLNECRINKDRFTLDEGISGVGYGKEYRGGIILFPVEMKQHALTALQRMTYTYRVGNFFKGKFVGNNGEEYNERSVSVVINGISSLKLLRLAESLLPESERNPNVLVKDFNSRKIYELNSTKQTIQKC